MAAHADKDGVETERKFLLAAPPPADILATAAGVYEIEQVYLLGEGPVKRRVRKLVDGDDVHYLRTDKERVGAFSQYEVEQEITEADWQQELSRRDPSRLTVHKRRYLFQANGHLWELDHLLAPVDLWVAEVELASEDEPYEVPAVFGEVREVTLEPRFSNRAIAKGSLRGKDG